MDFPCERTINIYDRHSGCIIARGDIKQWKAGVILAAIANAPTGMPTKIWEGKDGTTVAGNDINMAPIVSSMYPTGCNKLAVIDDINRNIGAFAKRVDNMARAVLLDETDRIEPDALITAHKVLSAFDRGHRPPKAVWAPIQK